MISYLICDREIESKFIKITRVLISFKFGDVGFLDIMKFLGEAKTLDSFLKAYKASETKSLFRYELFDSPDMLECTELPPWKAFFSKRLNHNPLEKDFIDYQELVKRGLQSTILKFYPFFEEDKDLCDIIGEVLTGGLSKVF